MTYIIQNSTRLSAGGSGTLDANNVNLSSPGSLGAIAKAIGNPSVIQGTWYSEVLVTTANSNVGFGLIPTGSSSSDAASLDSQKAIVYYSDGSVTNTSFSTPTTVSLLPLKGSVGQIQLYDRIANKTWTPTSAALAPLPTGGSQALKLSGTTQYVTGLNSADFAFTGNFTLQCYVYPTDLTKAVSVVINKRAPTGNSTGWNLSFVTNQLAFQCYNNPTVTLNLLTGSIFTANTMYHIAVVRNGTTVTLYVNGVSAASGTVGPVATNANPIIIGRQTSDTTRDFPGFISGLKIDNTALWTSDFTPPTSLGLAPNTTCSGTTPYGATYAAGDRIGMKLSLGFRNNFTVEFFKNGVSQGTLYNLGYLPQDYIGGISPVVVVDGTTAGTASIGFDRYSYFTPDTCDILGSDCLWTKTRLPPLSGTNNYYTGNKKGIQAAVTTAVYQITATQPRWTGKKYIEYSVTGSPNFANLGLGISPYDNVPTNASAIAMLVYRNGTMYVNNVAVSSGFPGLTNNDTFQLALDFDAGTFIAGKNNSYFNGVFYDYSPNPKAVTVTGVTQNTSNTKVGDGSASFSGSGQYLTVASSSDFTFGTGDYTIETWVYPTALNGAIIDFRPASTNGWYPTFGIATNGALGPYLNGVTISCVSAAGAISINNWYHLAMVRQAGVTKFYINGVSQGTPFNDPNNYPLPRVIVGRNAFVTNLDFPGLQDEIRISNVARYTANFTPSTTAFTPDANTVLLLHFDNIPLTFSFTPADLSGSGWIPSVYNVGGNALTSYLIRTTAQNNTGGSALPKPYQQVYSPPSGYTPWSDDWTQDQYWLPNGDGNPVRTTAVWADVVTKYNGYVNTEVSQVYGEVLVKNLNTYPVYASSVWADVVQSTYDASETRFAQVYAEVLIRNPPPNDTRVTVMWKDVVQATNAISETQFAQVYGEVLIKQDPTTPDSPDNPNPGVQVTMQWKDVVQKTNAISETQFAQVYGEVLIKNQTTTKYPIITVIG